MYGIGLYKNDILIADIIKIQLYQSFTHIL